MICPFHNCTIATSIDNQSALLNVSPSPALKFKTSFKNCVLTALKNRGWKEVQNDEWDLQWCQKQNISQLFQQFHMSQQQRVNHFSFYYQLCRKDYLIKNLKKTKRLLEKEGRLEEALSYSFFPQTFFLPSQYSLFSQEFKRVSASDPKRLWIMKPVSKCQGRGIFIINKLSQISGWKNKTQNQQSYIVQSYIMEPLLISRKKFDMRIYVLCTNYSSLTLYLYRQGFARFTHQPYDDKDFSNLYSHLTNVAIQKNSQAYDEQLGGKWFLDRLKVFLLSRYGETAIVECFNSINTLIIKTQEAVQKQIINDKHCFQLYGYDIILDKNLKPWLLQVNGGPSMTSNTQEDCALKCALIDDVLTIVDMQKLLTGSENQVGGFDLIYKAKPYRVPANHTYGSYLGCKLNRTKNLKRIVEMAIIRLAKQKEAQKEKREKQQQEQEIKRKNKKEKLQRQSDKERGKGPPLPKRKETKKADVLKPKNDQ